MGNESKTGASSFVWAIPFPNFLSRRAGNKIPLSQLMAPSTLVAIMSDDSVRTPLRSSSTSVSICSCLVNCLPPPLSSPHSRRFLLPITHFRLVHLRLVWFPLVNLHNVHDGISNSWAVVVLSCNQELMTPSLLFVHLHRHRYNFVKFSSPCPFLVI